MEKDVDIPLPEAMMLLQSIVLSCVDRKQFPYSRTQLNIFIALALEGEMTMKQVARYLASSQEQATRALAPLADNGFIERRIDPLNRTRVYVHLTEEGTRYLAEQREQLYKSINVKLKSALSEEEYDAIHSSVGTMIPLLTKIRNAEK